MCYYCANGLPPKVKAIFDDVEKVCPEPGSGPGHIVYSDYNLELHHILWCIEQHDLPDARMEYGWPESDWAASRDGLVKLAALSEEDRHISQAVAYDEEMDA